ncbi:MAG: hypothetical protein LBC82_03620 [Oscillospiraceae bacterium]|jgi:hypothetical protein|nr:hypothetical protein [Oscillospiraceae bacterium]
MSENLKNSAPEKEINLNLKIPPEQQESTFSMRDLVLTLYNARKIFFIWCLIGLLLGTIVAGAYYIRQTRSSLPVPTTGDVSIILTLNYPGAEAGLFPNGAGFNIRSFYEKELWENTIKAVGNYNITPADAMSAVKIMRYKQELDEHGQPITGSVQDQLLLNTLFELTIPSGSTMFANGSEKEAFLQAFCEVYKNSINSKYFNGNNIGILYNQEMNKWNNLRVEIILDAFDFEKNFSALRSKYSDMETFFKSLYDEDPLYRSAGGKSFNDFANDFRDIRINEIRPWQAAINENIYVRNIDRLKNEYQIQISLMRLNREYSLELIASYNDLLTSFQQKDATDGSIVWDAVNIMNYTKTEADTAAELQKKISQMEYNIRMLETNEQELRANSREAESALTAFIDDLEKNQAELTMMIYDYYRQANERNSENSIIFTTPRVTQTEVTTTGVSTTRLLMIFIGLAFVGFAIGFCAAFVKKWCFADLSG